MKIVLFDDLVSGSEPVEAIRSVDPAATVVEATEENLVAELAGAEIFFGYQPPDVFTDANQLKWIQSTSAGMDHLMNVGFETRGILVTNASGVHAAQVAETAWAHTLSLARSIPTFVRQQDQAIWQWSSLHDLFGATCGIIGLGGIGRYYARVAAAFGMKIVAVDKFPTNKPDFVNELWRLERLKDLLQISDFVLISCPATDETQNLIATDELSCMKPSAILINIARGGIVNEVALVEALRSGRLAAAGLDVCSTEPLPPDSVLWRTSNLLITPHCAGLSHHRVRRLTDFFCDNLLRYKSGTPLRNLVDLSRGYPVPTGEDE